MNLPKVEPLVQAALAALDAAIDVATDDNLKADLAKAMAPIREIADRIESIRTVQGASRWW
ncbi:MAG: hypothetical protein ACK5CE_12390 [Actinomycetes bacterium]|nr:hypothetical protein [Actinomycetota bacterium]